MNRENFTEQLAALHQDAFGWALHCCRGDAGLAEEVLQCAYVKWLQGRLHHTGTGSVKAWWLEVVRLTALEESRRVWRRATLFGRVIEWFTGEDDQEAEDSRPQPARQAELNEESARLRSLLAQLPARQAEVLHLVFYEHLTIEEAAAVMRVGLGSARTHYDRGKRRLRQWLEQEGAR